MILLAGLIGCGTNSEKCSDKDGKAAVLEIMREVYLWNDEPTQSSKYSLNLKDYDDANHLLDFLRYLPDTFDRGFSYITTTSSDEQFFNDGEYPGFGFYLSDLVLGELFITEVISGSPADLAGFERGYRIDAIGGLSVDLTTPIEEIYFALGPPEVGVTRSFSVTDLSGDSQAVNLTTEIVVIDALPLTDVFAVNGDMVGYMIFHVFNTPAEAELRQAFGDFKSQGVSRLIVDLRYNGGGRVDVAATFNSLLGGPLRLGMVQFALEYNQRYSDLDFDVPFEDEANSINLDQIVFITTQASASASELLINSLSPYVDVRTVGDRTFGKPVGQGGFDFCEESMLLRAVSFRTVNSNGDGDYFNGLAPDCLADDDRGYFLGDPMEASLAAALTLIETDACPVTVTASRATRFERRRSDAIARGTTPWRREARVF
jgi:carboxyl-terminal processing protease